MKCYMCPVLKDATEQEIAFPSVTSAKCLSVRKEGDYISPNTIFLTVFTTTLHCVLDVDPSIPNL